jgi:hypothetical protein
MRTFLVLCSVSLVALAQVPQTNAQPAGQQPSVAPEWDVSKVVAAFSDQAGRLKPILDQLRPKEWVSKGAPETFVAQWQEAEQELAYVTQSAKSLENDPERLTLALDTYFRWQRLASDLSSLVEGVRHYQNPAVGDLVVSVLGENTSNRELLQQHITDLAAQKEQEFAVVDQEAQRCRGTVTRTPVRPAIPRSAAPKTAPPKPANPQ